MGPWRVILATIILVSVVVMPAVRAQSQEVWLQVVAQAPVYNFDGDYLRDAEPGEWYLVVAEEGRWALAVWELDPPDNVVWIELGPRVEVFREAIAETPPSPTATADPTATPAPPTATAIPPTVAPTIEPTPRPPSRADSVVGQSLTACSLGDIRFRIRVTVANEVEPDIIALIVEATNLGSSSDDVFRSVDLRDQRGRRFDMASTTEWPGYFEALRALRSEGVISDVTNIQPGRSALVLMGFLVAPDSTSFQLVQRYPC